MASLTWHRKGWRVRYRLYFPDGTSRVRTAERTQKRDADQLLGQAEKLESLSRQNALTREVAIPFRHWQLLHETDLARYFPHTHGPLTFDPRALLRAYHDACQRRMTSATAVYRNEFRAQKLVERLGNLSRLTAHDIRTWQTQRRTEVAPKTVNLELDVLRQLLDACQEQGWCAENPARAVKKLPWTLSRFPQALRDVQVQAALRRAAEVPRRAGPTTLAAQRYRLLVAGIFFGLRRGELQHLLYADTNGRQVYVQGKTLPDGRPWVPKDREARVIAYPGIERPIALVFGEGERQGYVFSPDPERQRPFHHDSLSQAVEPLLKALNPGLNLHALRHTFATWRLEMGDPMVRVQALMGHADANTLLRYAHVQPDPMADLLPLLG